MEAGEEGGSLVVHSGPSGGKVVVPELDLELGKEGIVDNPGIRVQVPRVEQDRGEAVVVESNLVVHDAVVLARASGRVWGRTVPYLYPLLKVPVQACTRHDQPSIPIAHRNKSKLFTPLGVLEAHL